MTTLPTVCPLCSNLSSDAIANKQAVKYYRCPECSLVFMGMEWLPALQVERERYANHNNDGNDPGYVKHLMDIGQRVIDVLPAGSQGLDYGSGPSPVMAALISERGYRCESYDPIFAPHRDRLRRRYDFITCCEAVEHFHRPSVEFVKLYNMLETGGVLGLKTLLVEDDVDLEAWHYANDWTHVCFFAASTFDWIAKRFGMELLVQDKGRVVMRKTAAFEPVQVVAGLIRNGEKFLVARRSAGSMAGKWEFPGGKLCAGETAGAALRREMNEEMGMAVEAGDRLASLQCPSSKGWLDLAFLEATTDSQPGRLTDHSEWIWADAAKCCEMDMPEADAAFVDMYLTSA